jgi:hypothetical protein
MFPIDTFHGETRRQLEEYIESRIEERVQKVIDDQKATIFHYIVKDRDGIMRERERIFTLVCRVCPNHEQDFRKIIMGNRK